MPMPNMQAALAIAIALAKKQVALSDKVKSKIVGNGQANIINSIELRREKMEEKKVCETDIGEIRDKETKNIKIRKTGMKYNF